MFPRLVHAVPPSGPDHQVPETATQAVVPRRAATAWSRAMDSSSAAASASAASTARATSPPRASVLWWSHPTQR
jgi:hypothetical protein